MSRFCLALLVFVTGCYLDVGTVVNVSPDAEGHVDAIAEGIEIMNDVLGHDVYRMQIAESGAQIDEEIVVRHHEGKFNIDKETAQTERNRRGVIIRMRDKCNALCFAHELGHAGGLHHEADPENMMFVRWGGTKLTEAQKRKVLMLDEDYRRGRE